MAGCRGGAEMMFAELKRVAGIDFSDAEGTAAALSGYNLIWTLIDNAQNAYDEESAMFWV